MKNNQFNIIKIISDIRAQNYNKEGLVETESAENYLREIERIQEYCIPEKRKKWVEYNRSLIYSPLIPIEHSNQVYHFFKIMNIIDFEILDEVEIMMNASEIMEVFHQTKDWNKVNQILEEQDHNEYTLLAVIEVLLEYSNIGVEFYYRYSTESMKKNNSLQELYQNALEYQEKKLQLKKRIIEIGEDINMEKLIKLLENNLDAIIKDGNKLEDEQITVRKDDLCITKIMDKERIDYYVLDNRYYKTLLLLDGNEPLNSSIKITISDEQREIKLRDYVDSEPIKIYMQGLVDDTDYIISKKKQLK